MNFFVLRYVVIFVVILFVGWFYLVVVVFFIEGDVVWFDFDDFDLDFEVGIGW